MRPVASLESSFPNGTIRTSYARRPSGRVLSVSGQCRRQSSLRALRSTLDAKGPTIGVTEGHAGRIVVRV